jgi:hypothetical protein
MVYLLLLAGLYSAGFAVLCFETEGKRGSAAFGIGFICLGLGFLAQTLLSLELNENAARLFYLFRVMLAAAWLGHGLLLALAAAYAPQAKTKKGWATPKIATWLTRGLVVASLTAFSLVALTQITAAVDWYRPENPIYGQIHDLLATNRPTRWLALGLNLYGAAALLGGAIYAMANRWTLKAVLPPLAPAAGAALLAAPMLLGLGEASPTFYLMEFAAPILVFAGAYGVTKGSVASYATQKRNERATR